MSFLNDTAQDMVYGDGPMCLNEQHLAFDDLLEAAEEIEHEVRTRWLTGDGSDDDQAAYVIVKNLRAAIRKARGK